MTNAIEVHALRKVYRGGIRRRARMALDGLDLVVPEGQVHGFLGPNGSGKTTTLRVLTGLVHADAGTVQVLGSSVPHHLADVVSQVGSVVESPKFFPTFSGRRNLALLARVAGFDEKRVDEALETVGLQGRDRDPVKAYSLGMRQRLGIASALLKRPRLLLLDEPTNGLDPGGMREVRNLLVRLAEGGTTVLLSSHLLNEVQQVCSSVTIVSHGKAVRSGSVREVLASGAVAGAAVSVRVRVADPPAAGAILTAAGLSVVSREDHFLVTGAASAEVNRMLGERGIWADEIAPDEAALEDVFLSLTGEGAPSGKALPPVEGPGPTASAGPGANLHSPEAPTPGSPAAAPPGGPVPPA